MDPFLGQILIIAFNYPPPGWAFCNGQLLSVSQNSALFSILGTTYGGDGRTTFGLPDLRSRIPIHQGQGPGLSNYNWGQVGGNENVTLTVPQMPMHTHGAVLKASGASATDASPTGNYLADGNQYTNTQNTQMAADAVTVANQGGNQPHTNIQPYLCLNFIIAISGIYPSRQ